MFRGSASGYTSLQDDNQQSPTSDGARGETARVPIGTTSMATTGGGSNRDTARATYTNFRLTEPLDTGSSVSEGAIGGTNMNAADRAKQRVGNSNEVDGGNTRGHSSGDSAGKDKVVARASEETGLVECLPTAEGIYVGSPVERPSSMVTGATPVVRAPTGNATLTGPSTQVLNHSGPNLVDAGGRPTVIVLRTGSPSWDMWGHDPREVLCPGCGYAGFSHTVQVRMRLERKAN